MAGDLPTLQEANKQPIAMLQLKSATKVPNDGKRFNNFLSDIYLCTFAVSNQ